MIKIEATLNFTLIRTLTMAADCGTVNIGMIPLNVSCINSVCKLCS